MLTTCNKELFHQFLAATNQPGHQATPRRTADQKYMTVDLGETVARASLSEPYVLAILAEAGSRLILSKYCSNIIDSPLAKQILGLINLGQWWRFYSGYGQN